MWSEVPYRLACLFLLCSDGHELLLVALEPVPFLKVVKMAEIGARLAVCLSIHSVFAASHIAIWSHIRERILCMWVLDLVDGIVHSGVESGLFQLSPVSSLL